MTSVVLKCDRCGEVRYASTHLYLFTCTNVPSPLLPELVRGELAELHAPAFGKLIQL